MSKHESWEQNRPMKYKILSKDKRTIMSVFIKCLTEKNFVTHILNFYPAIYFCSSSPLQYIGKADLSRPLAPNSKISYKMVYKLIDSQSIYGPSTKNVGPNYYFSVRSLQQVSVTRDSNLFKRFTYNILPKPISCIYK